jgi:hypothetical protein
MTLERMFTIVSGLLLLVALLLLWRNNLSAAFVIATLGVAAWFLSYRAQLRAKIVAAETPAEKDNGIDEDY